MSLKENNSLTIQTLDDLLRCINLASSLELLGYPKCGNVHRTKNFELTKFEHFFAGISAIQPNFRDFCKRIEDIYSDSTSNFKFVNLGKFYLESTIEMMKWQRGGNVLLGHILILAPLVASATICFKAGTKKLKDFIQVLEKVINDATVEDTVNLFKAIRLSKPGGLGKINKYDINDENSLIDIEKNKITLKTIFGLSKGYDSISMEYFSNFKIILNENLPYYLDIFNRYRDINAATVNTFLKILSEHPDTLILRKSGKEAAIFVSKRAGRILEKGGVLTKKGNELLKKFDKKLHKQKGAMNPGTTADLIAGVIFCALLFGLRF